MDKFAIDLDSILDQLEENDDDTEVRGHPPSLVKIANNNTYGYNRNNFSSLHSYCNEPTVQTSNDGSACSTSSTPSNAYKRHLLSSYMESQAMEPLDSSEADFGISIKRMDGNDNDNNGLSDLNNEKTTYIANKEVNSSAEKSRLIASLLEKAMWNTEDMTSDIHHYHIDTTSVDEEVADEVLSLSIDPNSDTNVNNDLLDAQELPSSVASVGQQIDISLLSTNLTQLTSDDNTSDLSANVLHNNNDSDLRELEDNTNALDCIVTHDNGLEEETNQVKLVTNSESEFGNELNENTAQVIEFEDEIETDVTSDDIVINDGNKWETDSLKNNFDETLTANIMKFNEIEVNIDELTEQEINEYLKDFDDNSCDNNELINPNISSEAIATNLSNICSNINIETNNESTNNDFLNTTSDKDMNSMSQSTSSVSIEDNDKISDISDFDVSHQSNNCSQNQVNYNNCVDNQNASICQTEDIPSKISRPNTLPIASAIAVNSVEVNEELIDNLNDELNDDNDNNNVPNDDDLVANIPNGDFNEQNVTLGLNENISEDLTHGLSEDEQMLGKIKPFWIPDTEAQMCMHCDIKFNLIKRRHHCRACGKVLCAQCCNSRAKLLYLDGEVARVCQICYSTLARIAAIERNANDLNPSTLRADSVYPDSMSGPSMSHMRCPDPNNPSEYCSTISPLEQEQDLVNRVPPSVMVPVGVLKRGDRPKGEPKQVVFSDGIRPGGDLTETSDTSSSNLSFLRRTGRVQHKLKSPPVEAVTTGQMTTTTTTTASATKSKASRIVITDANGTLPPIINYYDLNINKTVKNKPTILNLIEFLKNKDLCPVVFALTKNLHIYAKIVLKSCCVKSEVWTFASKGMATIGQDEILVSLERLTDEEVFPRDIFRLFTTVYDSATKGSAFNDLSHLFFPDGLFGNKDNSGFLFARPTLQCFNNLVLPSAPFLLAILIHKWEIPWAKVFPIRLLLRLGAEYKYYPSPIVSYRCRKPVYCEIGHTIMNVLADFRNFQYTLPTVSGLTIHLEDKKITVHLPRNRYEKVQKVVTNSNEHVLAFGANFSLKADSHLVCMQNDVDGQYQTQSINIDGAVHKITGASFIVFSGALKSNTGLTAKMSIVEDGLLVQIPPNTMTELRNAIKDMKDYDIKCGKVDSPPEEVIHMSWAEEDMTVNLGVRSPIDATNLEGIQSIRIYNGTDYTNNKFVIRWTEVFFLHINEISRRNDSLDSSRLAEMIAQSFCLALTSCLDHLFDNGFTKIGLRINLDSDRVGYEVGSNGTSLPAQYTTELDGALIPVIMDNISSGIEDQLVMELLFHILVK